jgi:hypothetical protein
MACLHFQDVHIFTHDYFVPLEEFGSKVWCSFHNYCGPTFYRSEAAITEIRSPSPKTWRAFQSWRDSIDTPKEI